MSHGMSGDRSGVDVLTSPLSGTWLTAPPAPVPVPVTGPGCWMDRSVPSIRLPPPVPPLAAIPPLAAVDTPAAPITPPTVPCAPPAPWAPVAAAPWADVPAPTWCGPPEPAVEPCSAGMSGSTSIRPSPCAPAGISRVQPGRIRLSRVSRSPSGCSRPSFSAKISLYRMPEPRYRSAMSQRLSWCRPCGGMTTYCLTPPVRAAAVVWPGCSASARTAAAACLVAESAWPTVAVATCCMALATEVVAAAGRPAPPVVVGAEALCSPCPTVASSSTAVTSRRARSCWAPDANGIRLGRPLPRMPAASSLTRQATSWAQASQTMQTMTSSTNSIGTCWLNGWSGHCGIGLPASSTRPAGMATTIASISTAARKPRNASPRSRSFRMSRSGAPVMLLLTATSRPSCRAGVSPTSFPPDR